MLQFSELNRYIAHPIKYLILNRIFQYRFTGTIKEFAMKLNSDNPENLDEKQVSRTTYVQIHTNLYLKM